MAIRFSSSFAAVLMFMLATIASAAPQQQATSILTIGIVPQQAAGTLAKIWVPTLDFLSKQTGYSLRFATAKDIATFEQRLAAGEYDIAYMNPYHYTVFHRAPGYRVFAKEKDTKLIGIVVVRKEDRYSDLGQLRGQTLAFPSPISFAATLLPQAEFRKLGIPIESKYVASHDSVYLAVARGLYVAGGGIPRTYAQLSPERREKLRVLWNSAEYTPHAFAAHPRISNETVARIKAVMLNMATDPEGAVLLQTLGFKGIVAAQTQEYDNISSMETSIRGDLTAK